MVLNAQERAAAAIEPGFDDVPALLRDEAITSAVGKHPGQVEALVGAAAR